MNYDYFENALKPKEVFEETAEWTKIRSYVYVIRKKFAPYQMALDANERKKKLHTKLNLFKIGMSSVSTSDGKSKGGTRLNSLRTGLINFDVFRIYVYPAFQQADGDKDTDGKNAKIAESWLHNLVDSDFKHDGVFRIEFRGDKGIGQAKSEWFAIPQAKEEKFLAFLDNAVFAGTGTSVANAVKPYFGTGFEKKSVFNVAERVDAQPMITGVRAPKKTKLTAPQKTFYRSLRKTANIYRRTAEQVESQIRMDEIKKAQKEEDKKRAAEFAQSLDHWKKTLINKQFKLKKGEQMGNSYVNKYLTKVITDVKKVGRNYYAMYEPFMRAARKAALDQQVLQAESGPLRVNELLDYLPALLKIKKNKVSYDYFNRLNHRNTDINYEDELLPG